MQLDRVRRDPGLAVVEVEEGDPRNASAEPDMAPGQAHLATPQRGCVPVARRTGRAAYLDAAWQHRRAHEPGEILSRS